jgi:hypothetical protein
LRKKFSGYNGGQTSENIEVVPFYHGAYRGCAYDAGK